MGKSIFKDQNMGDKKEHYMDHLTLYLRPVSKEAEVNSVVGHKRDERRGGLDHLDQNPCE